MTDEDFISSMPDEILRHILSFTPTKLVIRTSALSKRWNHVWYGMSSVSIDCHNKYLIPQIHKSLRSFSAPKITSFNLCIGRQCLALPCLIDSLIEIAMSRKAENMSLVIKTRYIFRDLFFVNSDVKKLSVTLARFQYDMIPTSIVSWSSLRELSLNSCDLPDESFDSILPGCPMLETLMLNFCRKLCRLDLSKSLNLRRLEITFGRLIITQPLEIVAPQILYLKLAKCFRLCTLLDISSLTEAYFSLSDYKKDLDSIQNIALKMLANLQSVEKLTIRGVILQILSLAKFRGVPFPQLKTKVLIVETMVVQTVMTGIAEMLQSSPGLKKITVYTRKHKAIADMELDEYLYTKGLNPYECWCGFFPMVKETSSCLNGIAEDAKSEHVASFMELVLRNSEILEKMVLNLGGYLSATEYHKLLTIVPKGSRSKNGEAKAIFNGFKIIP